MNWEKYLSSQRLDKKSSWKPGSNNDGNIIKTVRVDQVVHKNNTTY